MRRYVSFFTLVVAMGSLTVAAVFQILVVGAVWFRAYTISETVAIVGFYLVTPVGTVIALASLGVHAIYEVKRSA